MANIDDAAKQLERSQNQWNEIMEALQSLPPDAAIQVSEELLEQIDGAFTPAPLSSVTATPGFHAIRV
ncbi:MAG: hypothetical protein MUF54_11030 [Polyangiaceae bacterium]|jgi:hypothetical protein|nr:hypothetical protein [Polyangiaceae bacterium]